MTRREHTPDARPRAHKDGEPGPAAAGHRGEVS